MLPACFIELNFINQFEIPTQLNDPFKIKVTSIVDFAAKQLQSYILQQQDEWKHDFGFDSISDIEGVKGKMFGVLVVQSDTNKIGYLAGYSGKLDMNNTMNQFVPSIFDDSTDDFFINKGMSDLTTIGNEIKQLERSKNQDNKRLIIDLKTQRASKSTALQQRLFDNYNFSNCKGEIKNLCAIFKDFNAKKPPSAAGECAAPKLLQYAFQNHLKPIGIAEFWWGKSPKSEERIHLGYYPACNDKCRPILNYMLS